MPKYAISVIIPALNEEKNVIASIDNTLAAFDDLSIEGEVIAVDDGSRDATSLLIAEKAKADIRIRILTHARPMGVGACFWDGVDNARYDIVTFIPADNENDPWETLRYIGLLEHVDIVIPFAFNKNIRSLLRNIMSFAYLFIINTTFMTSFNYTNSTVIYRKSVLQQLKHRSKGFLCQTDILIRATKRGYLFSEVPYRIGERKSGKSKLLSFSTFRNGIRDYFILVRDIYIRERKELKKKDFSPDSSTLKRYMSNAKFKRI